MMKFYVHTLETHQHIASRQSKNGYDYLEKEYKHERRRVKFKFQRVLVLRCQIEVCLAKVPVKEQPYLSWKIRRWWCCRKQEKHAFCEEDA